MFGDTLKQLRLIFGYSAKEMSDTLEISASYLSEIENNKKRPSLNILESYANVFGLKLSTLILLTEKHDKLSDEGKGKLVIRKIMLKLIAKSAGEIDE